MAPIAANLARTFSITLLAYFLNACAFTPYQHGSINDTSLVSRALEMKRGDFVVRTSVPGEKETAEIFGIAMYERGIQPVWLEIINNSPARARFIVSSVDKDYFSPNEVAYMHRKLFSKQGWRDLEMFLMSNTIPRMVPPGKTVSGFVFTHASRGTKAFNVDVVQASVDTQFENFTFFVPVPGFVPDHAEVNFAELYGNEELQHVDREGLRKLLPQLPCCTTNHDNSGQGQPVHVALIGEGLDILQALLRAGWSETSYTKDSNYMINSSYFFSRPPDATFRKGRGETTERNELSLWLSPVRVDGVPLWLGQVKHAIGRRFEVTEMFLGTALDPNVDDGRNFLLQNLWYTHSLKAFAFSDTGVMVPSDQPIIDFNGNSFFTDGIRIAMWISGDPVSLDGVRNLFWVTIPEINARQQP